jgi:hypothetical protein
MRQWGCIAGSQLLRYSVFVIFDSFLIDFGLNFSYPQPTPNEFFHHSGSGGKEHTMKKGICFIPMVLFLFFATLSFAAPNMEDGLWEITSMMDMPGMPARSFTHSSCLTKEKAVPQTSQSDCTIKDVKNLGNTITWTVVCREGATMSKGKVTYAGTTMDGVIETTTNGKTMTMRIKGKRIGPCK